MTDENIAVSSNLGVCPDCNGPFNGEFAHEPDHCIGRLRAELKRLDADAACEKAEKESLKLEVERLRAALERIVAEEQTSISDYKKALQAWAIAKDALEGGAVETTPSRSVQRRIAAQKGESTPTFETTGYRMHDDAKTTVREIARKLDIAEELTDCERGCAADALRDYAWLMEHEQSAEKASEEPDMDDGVQREVK
jgi:hypothetical protein